MMANGMLAGLVAITAPCAFVQPWAAAVIGGLAGVFVDRVGVVLRAQAQDRRPGRRHLGARRLRHLGRAVRSASSPTASTAPAGTAPSYRTRPPRASPASSTAAPAGASSAPRSSACLTIAIVMGGIAFAFFKIQNKLMKGGIRAEEADERKGMDAPEMGVLRLSRVRRRPRCAHELPRHRRRRRRSDVGTVGQSLYRTRPLVRPVEGSGPFGPDPSAFPSGGRTVSPDEIGRTQGH